MRGIAIAVVSAYQKQMDKQEEQEEESNALVWAQRDRVVDTGYVVRGADSAHVRLEIHVTAHSDESEGRH